MFAPPSPGSHRLLLPELSEAEGPQSVCPDGHLKVQPYRSSPHSLIVSLAEVESLRGVWLSSVFVRFGLAEKHEKLSAGAPVTLSRMRKPQGIGKCIDSPGSACSWDVLLWCGPEMELTVA